MERGIDDLLRQHAFFQGMLPPDLEFVAGCGRNVKFDEGRFLAREGDEAREFFALRAGRVAVEIYVPSRGPVAIQTVQEGDILGWSWLVPPYKWMFDMRALETTRAVQFDAACLRQKCEKNHALGFDLMKRFARLFAKRLEATRLQLLDVYGQTEHS